jgi:hypothetical protein
MPLTILNDLISSDRTAHSARLLPDEPLPARAEAERDHAASASRTSLVVDAVPAVLPMIEVDAVFAVAATLSLSHGSTLQLGSHIGSPAKKRRYEELRIPPLTWDFLVELVRCYSNRPPTCCEPQTTRKSG